MAIIIVNDLAPDVTADEYARVSEIVQAQGDPDGLVFHTGFMNGDHIQVVDAWESREQFDAFRESTLVPAVMQVMGDRMDGPPPEPAQHEPLDLQTR
jgi:quinol monooxygenase YgiN